MTSTSAVLVFSEYCKCWCCNTPELGRLAELYKSSVVAVTQVHHHITYTEKRPTGQWVSRAHEEDSLVKQLFPISSRPVFDMMHVEFITLLFLKLFMQRHSPQNNPRLDPSLYDHHHTKQHAHSYSQTSSLVFYSKLFAMSQQQQSSDWCSEVMLQHLFILAAWCPAGKYCVWFNAPLEALPG